jgi:hypothetical protein
VPTEAPVRSCNDAAAGLERSTRGLRAPEASVLAAMRARCVDDAWTTHAIECFAKLREREGSAAELGERELVECAGLLDAPARARMLAALGEGGGERVTVEIARARLAGLQVGIPECDRFVATVARVLTCDAMSLDVRAQLGAETVDLWALPRSGLPADAQQRMAQVCGRSTVFLEQQAVDAGCMP